MSFNAFEAFKLTNESKKDYLNYFDVYESIKQAAEKGLFSTSVLLYVDLDDCYDSCEAIFQKMSDKLKAQGYGVGSYSVKKDEEKENVYHLYFVIEWNLEDV